MDATHRIKVLIVDDDPIAADGLRSILLRHSEIEVTGTASDGLQAIDMAEESRPDLILMDAQMPGIDGAETTRRIKRRLPKSRILFLTVHPTHIRAALEAGADGYLMKDASRQELLDTIRELGRPGGTG